MGKVIVVGLQPKLKNNSFELFIQQSIRVRNQKTIPKHIENKATNIL